jgi:beta-galactosidase
MVRAGLIGRYEESVDALQTNYVFPQENGNRSDVRWLEFRPTERRTNPSGLRITGDPDLAFSARRWTIADLDQARHAAELVPRDRIWVTLDTATQGLGTASCGPALPPEYRLHPENLRFALSLQPIANRPE